MPEFKKKWVVSALLGCGLLGACLFRKAETPTTPPVPETPLMASVSSPALPQEASVPALAVPQLPSSQSGISPWDKLRESVSGPVSSNGPAAGLGMQILGFRTPSANTSVPVSNSLAPKEPNPFSTSMNAVPPKPSVAPSEVASVAKDWAYAPLESASNVSPRSVPLEPPHARLSTGATYENTSASPTTYPSTEHRSPNFAVREVSYAQHTIRDGDSLYSLAQRYLGDGRREMELFEENRNVLQNPQILPIGVTLRIPNSPLPVRQTNVPDRTQSNPVGQLVPISPDAWK